MNTTDNLTDPEALTIVLAEDDPGLSALYATTLGYDGHRVHPATDGARAIELVDAVAPDLLILDLWMPVLNGLEVLEFLRGRGGFRFKVVILSNHSDADKRLEGFALGIDDYWTKDLTLMDLRERVRGLSRGIATPALYRQGEP